MIGSVCSADEVEFEESCYYVEQNVFSFTEAQENCQNMGMNLTSIISSAENSFVHSITEIEGVWIGLELDGNNAPHSTWSDGAAVEYLNWADREPNGGHERCTGMDRWGQWKDWRCSLSIISVCKKSQAIQTFDSTAYPTFMPTIDPTLIPSVDPIRGPSQNPSCGPTQIPSFPPTNIPTPLSTSTPTHQPSKELTKSPSMNRTWDSHFSYFFKRVTL